MQDDLLNAVLTDTVTLIAYSVEDDTLNTTGLVFNFLGTLKDNVFGTTTASIYTQLAPYGNNVSFGDSPKLDSVVLTLRYTGGFYGDTLNPFTIKVYELKEDISTTTTYYQHHSIEHFDNNLTYSDFHLYPKPKTKIKVDTLTDAHIRIRLKDELGERFIRDAKDLATDETFLKYFKGLYISAEPFRNDGSLVNFSLTASLSGIQIYYHEKDNDKPKQFSLNIKRTSIRFNSYKHNYETGSADFVSQVVEKDTLKGKQVLYLQSMGGIKTKITFPYLKTFKERKVVINKAELVITNIGESLDLYPMPAKLGIQAVDLSGKLVTIPDVLTGNSNYFGGSYDEKTKEYRFRITRYIQDVIQKNKYQPYIYLVPEGAAAYANRLILKGTDTKEPSRLRLEIYYTEY